MTSPSAKISRSLCSSVALIAVLAAPAAAQQREPDYEAAFKAGTALFERGEFAAAREKFEAAYAIHPVPLLLLNIGSTYRREGDNPRALEYYQRFLDEADADSEYRAKVAEIVAELEAEIAEEEKARREQEEAAPAAPEPAPEPTPEPVVEPPPETADTASPGRRLRLAGLITAGVGAVALGIGVQQGLHARSIDDELEGKMSGTAWTPEIQQRYDDGQAAETRAIVFGVAGGVALAAGVTLYLRGRDRAEHPPSLTVAPFSDGASTGLAVSGQF